ncbi:NAD(P)-dependent dehydrogenase (short-subunit alcohol dehydrogenase family) [Microbacterium resistens]|uniref:NAD(P)-dependent dehydrogenase (Short-subunit alcohol dehydrogenase family) n=1 Tax=Microbacterium resistens TaxID=156977 RepID=A0ABU1SF05_9MICO|nr:SDR family oxidoreductase [Microbacterium resistens]MDR6868180.1 NAD(P)-dependent dehydrogenase (short-subunit alcohol dehydrogenase family) [Microbacterium resistens]
MYTVTDQRGRRFIITGSNSGTGREAARRLAAAGADVVLAVRTPAKGEETRAAILRESPDAQLEVRRLDLADLASVRDFAAGILEDSRPVHVLVNNAGVMAPRTRFETVDGFELQFGSNFLGPFALTNLLLPTLLAADAPRVTTMSSGAANIGRIRFDDLQSSHRYGPFRSYAQSKLADMLMGRQLAKVSSERRWGLLSTVAHPGYTRTNLQTAGANLGRARQRTPIESTLFLSQEVEQGAEPLLFAASDPTAAQGAYYGPNGLLGMVGPTKRADYPRRARSAQVAERLWAVAEELTGTSLPAEA